MSKSRNVKKYKVAVNYAGYSCVVVDVVAESEEAAKILAPNIVDELGLDPLGQIDSVAQGEVVIIK